MLEGMGVAGLTPSQRQAVGRSFYDLYPESRETRQRVAHALDGTVVNWSERIGEYTFETTLSPLRDREGVVTGLVGVGFRKSGEVVLPKPQGTSDTGDDADPSLRSLVLAQVSHEFRTPLNSIVGFASLLAENSELHLGEQDLFYIQRIIGNATHLLGVVGHMLNLTVIETGRIGLTLSEVDLGSLIRETVGEIQNDIRGRTLEMRLVIPDGALPLETDRQKLKQVLINLLANALKFTQEGSVAVSLIVDEFYRPERIEVTDTGIGIPVDKLDAIFDAFERGETAGNQKVEGTGLGLTISRAFCKLMGYNLRAASELGKGSTFTIVFSHRPAPTPE